MSGRLQTNRISKLPKGDQKKNNKKAWIWRYFQIQSNKSAQCKVCEKEIARSNGTTSGMRNHMKLIHKITEPAKVAEATDTETVDSEVSEDETPLETLMDENEYKSKSKKSWIWRYFEEISSCSAKCNICSREIGRPNYSTSSMRNHVKLIHKIIEQDLQDVATETVKSEVSDDFGVEDEYAEKTLIAKTKRKVISKKAWIWRHFEVLSKTSAKCKICWKEIARSNGTTSGMRNHMKLIHKITEPAKGAEATETVESEVSDDEAPKDEKEDKRNNKKAWVWRYFEEISSSSAKCNICSREIGRPNYSTSSMLSHMKLIHKISESQTNEAKTAAEHPSVEYQADTKQRSSLVWRHFQLISSTSVKCNICERVLQRSNGSTSTMRSHLKTHDIDTSDTKTAPIEFKSVPKPPHFVGYSKENCYVCNVKLGSFKSELSTFTSTTETPLHEILENFTGAELSQTEIDGSSVCQKCFTSLEKYDDLLHQSQEISNNLTALLLKTHSEEVFIKDEPVFEDEVMQESSSQSFRENHPRRSLSESRDYVENDEQMDENSSDYNNDEPSHSETRADETDKIDKADKMKVEEDIRANGVVECSTCKATFKRSKNYFRHIQIHKPKDESLFCKTCTISFKATSSFQMHLATDHDRGTGPFDCPVCLKTFAEKKNLKAHFYIHTREETILCWQCGATFLQKKSLEMHLMAHDDIRPFECTIPGCTKKFRTSGKLNIHIRVHTGEKIYECPQCPGHRFAQKWGLDLHVKKQHNFEATPRVACKICGVKVMSKSKMKIHLQNNHDVADTEEDEIME